MTRPHQDLEEHHEQLVSRHEVTVQHAQVEPAAQTAEHLDEHLLVVARLLHARRLQREKTLEGGTTRTVTALQNSQQNHHWTRIQISSEEE